MTIVQPVDFGENIGWFIVHSYSVETILGCLDIVDEEPVFWADAIGKINGQEAGLDKQYLFISPEVDGWMFVVSKLLMEKGDDESFLMSDFVSRLSVVFGEVQAFANNGQGDYYHWIKAQDGSLENCFAYSALKKEIYCNTGTYDLPSLEKPEDVLKVAEGWSINPENLSQYESRGTGYIVEVSRQEFKNLIEQFDPEEYLKQEAERDLDLLTLSKVEQSINYYYKWNSHGFMGDYGLINLALSLEKNNQFEESITCLVQLLNDTPGCKYAELTLDNIYRKLESDKGFIIDCKENVKQSYDLYIKAFNSFIGDDNLSAIEFLIDAIDINPENTFNYYFLTEIFLELDDYINAQENANKLVAIGGEDEYLLSLLVHINFVLGENDKAIQVNETLKEKNNDSLLYLCNKAEMYENNAKYDEAIEVLMQAKELSTDFAEVFALTGSVLYLKGNIEEGVDNFNRAISLDPSSSKALLGLAIHYLRVENYTEAENYARKVVYYAPDNDTAYNLLGRSFIEQDKTEFAMECFAKAVDINESDDSSLAYMAYIYHLQEAYIKADEYVQKALAVNEKNVVANKIKEILNKHDKIESFEGFQYKFVLFMGVLILLCFVIGVVLYLYTLLG